MTSATLPDSRITIIEFVLQYFYAQQYETPYGHLVTVDCSALVDTDHALWESTKEILRSACYTAEKPWMTEVSADRMMFGWMYSYEFRIYRECPGAEVNHRCKAAS